MTPTPSSTPDADRAAAWWPVLGLVLGGVACWAWWPAEPTPVQPAAPRLADERPAPWTVPVAAAMAAQRAATDMPVAVPAVGPSPPATVPPGHAVPTLDASERAALREALAQVAAMDAAGRQEFEALLFQDGLQRLQALRQAGDRGVEHDTLLLELRAALPAHEAARALAPAQLQAARRALGLSLGTP